MFNEFKRAVEQQYRTMKNLQMYRTEVEKEMLWLTYLESFPAGSNPMMRERTEHDCSSCRSFIKAVGSMIVIKNGEVVSLWDCDVAEPYATVARAMSELVKAAPIKNILLHDFKDAGVDKNYEDGLDGKIRTWEHFHIVLPPVCVVRDRGSVYGEKRATMEVFRRALEEVTMDSLDTVLDLIAQNSLYRGEEHKFVVSEFRKLKKVWIKLNGADPKFPQQRDIFCWRQDVPVSVARVRNSAIGTLLVDLSEGKSLEEAVRMFESKVAPSNYRRPKALVTKAMVDRARKTVEDLGYTSALERRFAVTSDIRVTEVLFANRDARKTMGADVFDELVSEARADQRSLDKVEKVPIEKFVTDILPSVRSMELLLENRHGGNLVNLVAPRDPDAKLLFKWDNPFSWAYHGDLADSIKERVKAQGGSVTGDFRASLAWFNSDDLDLHLREPNGGSEIHFANKRSHTGGELDVDMNVNTSGPRCSRNAVENITYPRRRQMLPGTYKLIVHNFTHRERVDVGFQVEIEFDGTVYTFGYDREVRHKESVTVATFTYSHDDGLKIIESIPRRDVSRDLWGLPSQTFHPVQLMMLSPNHWGDRPVGNRHYFFFLQGCKREGSSRGFFNEYLREELNEHRKVFELLGSRMRTEEEGEQLSGLGFSSTQRNNVFAKLSGNFNRTINITF